MKNSIKNKIVSILVLLFVLLSSLIASSLAWLSSVLEMRGEDEFSGSSVVSYFAGGSGKSDDPYLITTARHLYNLSWLQSKHVFDEKTYFRVADKNGNPVDIDVKGQLTDDGETGAIPPIGSISNPFVGEFDGYGSIIRNLWISTDSDDWKRFPDGVTGSFEETDGTDYVGLFGAIADEAIIKNFNLDCIEVKCHIDATVGIICGYVHAMVYDVGVHNGIITIANGAVCNSDYSLLGAKHSSIIWEDMPELDTEHGGSKPGGVIKIDITDGKLTSLFKNGNLILTDDIAARDVHDAYANDETIEILEKRAYFTGNVTIGTQQKAPVFYFYSTPIQSNIGYDANGERLVNPDAVGDMTSPIADAFLKITAAANQNSTSTYYNAFHGTTNNVVRQRLTYNADFDNVINKMTSRRINIYTGTAPSYNNTVSIQYDGADKPRDVPANGIWFKPMAPGPTIITFTITSNNRDAVRSIYRYKRNQDGTIDKDSWTETKLKFNVKSGRNHNFSNGDIVGFQFNIDDIDVTEGYEFIIGTSTGESADQRVGFVFLALAGTSKNGPASDTDDEVGFRRAMYDVDYVTSPEVSLVGDYQIHQTILRLKASGAPTADTQIFYRAIIDNEETGDSSVYYYAPEPFTIEDISSSKQSSLAVDTSPFLERQLK